MPNNIDLNEVISTTVKKTLLELGLDVSNSHAVVELQKDFAHLRAWRGSVEEVKRKGFMTAVGIISAGAIGLFWAAFKGSLH